MVYKGTGTSVDLTNLSAGTAYHFAIYEYNDNCLIHNATELTGNFTSCDNAPGTQASNFTLSNLTNSSATVGWDRGNGNNVLVVARSGGAVNADPTDGTTYTADAAFGSGTQIGTGNYVVYKGASTSVNLTNLTASTTYHFAIYEYNNCLVHNATELTGNFTSCDNAPGTQASNFTLSNLTNSSATVGWDRGNGNNVLVVARSGGAVNADPTDGTTYTADAAFGSGTEIGTGNYVVYKGAGTSVNLSLIHI